MRPRFGAAFAALVPLASIGCGVTDPAAPVVVSIRLEPAGADLLTGENRQLTATLLDRSGNAVTGRLVTWATSAQTVATVSQHGWVTAVGAGQAVITAGIDNVTASAPITVTGRAASVEVSPGQATLDVFTDQVRLYATVRDAGGFNLPSWPVSWTSSDPAIVRISSDGLVTPVSTGSANVSARSDGRVGTATIVVTRFPVEAVSLSPSSVSLVRNSIYQFTPMVAGAGGKVLRGRTVVWSSSDPVVASVNQSGMVSTHAAGTATITATVEGHAAYAVLAVIELSFTSVAAGDAHTCALSVSGPAICWGENARGQVGSLSVDTCSGGWYDPYACTPTPAPVDGGMTFTELTAGAAHTCGLNPGGQAYCWGEGTYGALGHGSVGSRSTPIAVVGGLNFQSLTAGYAHTCGVTLSGAAFCWGRNEFGELGNGTTGNRTTPVAVAGGLSFVRLSAGTYHTCGITTAASLYCWGVNDAGQLGDGSLAHRTAPAAVMGNLLAVSLDAGSSHTCAITTAGDGYCWGGNYNGALGNGTTVNSPSPVAVAAGAQWKTITAGVAFSCGITSDNLAHCWGYNYSGQLGDGSSQERRTPAAVSGGLTFAVLSAGGAHACGRTTSGRLYCWGGAWSGQLGVGGFDGRYSPALVLGQP